MSVAVSDGMLHQSEAGFLKIIYQALNLPVRRIKSDIKNFSKSNFVPLDILTEEEEWNFQNKDIDEISTTLESIFEEFRSV